MPAQRPRLTIAGPLLRGSGELHIVGQQEVMTISDPDGAVHRLLGLADGSRDRSEILAELSIDYPLLGQQEVDEALLELEEAGLIEDYMPRGRIGPSRQPWAGGYERTVLSSF
ncbi:MAG TPA: hypothetical protein VGO80_07390 [Solirubrobacteraceae bacterium]|nr:hypothetical protein [Solirubrobacteraceae bacterium]